MMSKAARRFLARHREIERVSVRPTSPVTESEGRFRERALAVHGWCVHRPSWPDFLCETEDGEVFFVEVKSENDTIRPWQRETFSMLERIGIPVYVWHESTPDRLLRWQDDLDLARTKMIEDVPATEES